MCSNASWVMAPLLSSGGPTQCLDIPQNFPSSSIHFCFRFLCEEHSPTASQLKRMTRYFSWRQWDRVAKCKHAVDTDSASQEAWSSAQGASRRKMERSNTHHQNV